MLIIIFFIFPKISNSQINVVENKLQESKSDSTLDLLNLDPDSLKTDTDYHIYISKGWFPTPIPDYYGIGFGYFGGTLFDLAHSINSTEFAKSKLPLSSHNPLSTKDMQIMKKFNKDVDEDGPTSSNNGFYIEMNNATGLPLFALCSNNSWTEKIWQRNLRSSLDNSFWVLMLLRVAGMAF